MQTRLHLFAGSYSRYQNYLYYQVSLTKFHLFHSSWLFPVGAYILNWSNRSVRSLFLNCKFVINNCVSYLFSFAWTTQLAQSRSQPRVADKLTSKASLGKTSILKELKVSSLKRHKMPAKCDWDVLGSKSMMRRLHTHTHTHNSTPLHPHLIN